MNPRKIKLTNQVRSKYYKFLPVLGVVAVLIALLLGFTSKDANNASTYIIGLYGLVNLFNYFTRPMHNYFEFTSKGIYKPQEFWCFEKRDFLAYDAVEEAVFLVGDYVFRNAEVEFRIPKEMMFATDIEFLEDQLQKVASKKQIKLV